MKLWVTLGIKQRSELLIEKKETILLLTSEIQNAKKKLIGNGTSEHVS